MGTFAPVLGTIHIYDCFYKSLFNASDKVYDIYSNYISLRVYAQLVSTASLFNASHLHINDLGIAGAGYRTLPITGIQIAADKSSVRIDAATMAGYSTWGTVYALCFVHPSLPAAGNLFFYLYLNGASISAVDGAIFSGQSAETSPFEILNISINDDDTRNSLALQELV